MHQTPLNPGKYYHIYNRGNNSSALFFEPENYRHFLRLYQKYIDPIAETYAWCLMKNHFHLLVYIKEDLEIDYASLSYSRARITEKVTASKQFSHLFNAYTKAINKRFNRTGSLFEKNFSRKQVDCEKYFQRLIFYIHNNPVYHGFTETIIEYPWTSFGTVLSDKPTNLQREKVIQLFKNPEVFVAFHLQEQDLSALKELLIG